jgi:hypothetical protein
MEVGGGYPVRFHRFLRPIVDASLAVPTRALSPLDRALCCEKGRASSAVLDKTLTRTALTVAHCFFGQADGVAHLTQIALDAEQHAATEPRLFFWMILRLRDFRPSPVNYPRSRVSKTCGHNSYNSCARSNAPRTNRFRARHSSRTCRAATGEPIYPSDRGRFANLLTQASRSRGALAFLGKRDHRRARRPVLPGLDLSYWRISRGSQFLRRRRAPRRIV